MRKRTFVTKLMAITLIFFFAGAGLAVAGHGWRGMGRGDGVRMQALMNLDLDDAQKDKIAVLIQAHRDEQRKSREQFQAYREKLRDLAAAQEFSEADYREVIREMAPMMEARAVSRARLRHEIRMVLTPEQRDELAEKRGRFGDRRGKHRKGRRHAALDDWPLRDAE
jgi:protein CpxP